MAAKRAYLAVFAAFSCLAVFFSFGACFAEQVAVERITREPLLPRAVTAEKAPPEDKWYMGEFYELGDVVQGSRLGKWEESTTWFGRKDKKVNVYASFSRLRRFSEKDYTANLGFYTDINGYYIHEEAGLGWEVDFIYKFQNIAELSHKLYKDLFWQLGYTYRHYNINDTHLVYPGLTYYFGDNYVSANYGVSHIESRGTGQFGTIKGDFAVTKRLRWSAGTSVGQWLYDIYGFSARQERGYIAFTGLNFEVFRGVKLGAGYSYGTEKPKFIDRSFNVSLSAKF